MDLFCLYISPSKRPPPSLMRAGAICVAALLCCTLDVVDAKPKWRGRGRGRGGGGRGATSSGGPSPPMGHDYDTVDCPKCMTMVMRLLAPGAKGCPAANGTVVPSSVAGRVATSYCDTLLPKKRACIAYSFGLDGTWDFDKVRAAVHCCNVSARREMKFAPHRTKYPIPLYLCEHIC